MEIISEQTFSKERDLYAIKETNVLSCVFKDETDIAESPLKEAEKVTVLRCEFSLRYPLWHNTNASVNDCLFDIKSRAPLWYSKNVALINSRIYSPKAIRECENVSIIKGEAYSDEFAWRTKCIMVDDFKLESMYAFFESKDIKVNCTDFKGKYSFQYCENIEIKNSEMHTKDAFWHCKNGVIENCIIDGEYIGWYSDNLTFKNCVIKGTQPFCYCTNLKLIDCTLVDADFAFEYSTVEAELKGTVKSIKNPISGKIVADCIDEIILKNSKYDCHCEIKVRKK